MSGGEHPFVTTLGDVVDPEMLSDKRAASLARYAGSELDPDLCLIGCRKDPTRETVLVRVRSYPPQEPAADIRREEEFAVVFLGQDRGPALLALRPDFPETPHQTNMPEGLPRYPCVDDRDWNDAALTWTPHKYVERVRWWLDTAAMGQLSGAGQVLDPVFVPTGPDLIVSEDAVSLLENGSEFGLVPRSDLADDEIKSLHLVSGASAPGMGAARFRALLVKLPVAPAAALRAAPQTLAELCRALERTGTDLMEQLRSWACSTEQPKLDARVALLLHAPVTGAEDSAVREDLVAFALKTTLGELGQTLGVLDRQPDASASWGQVLLPGKADYPALDQLGLLAMRVQADFGPALARHCSGLPPGEPTPVLLIGGGAIGSHLALVLAREGRNLFSVADSDWFRPHNVVRHQLGIQQVGFAKAKALVAVLRELSAGDEAIVADALRPGASETALAMAAARAKIILDTSASVAVARHLASADFGGARRVSVFLNPLGDSAVLLAEDNQRTVRLDSLEAQYYRLVLRSPELSDHLKPPPEGFRYAAACRDVSARIPESRVASLSGLAAIGFSDAVGQEPAAIRAWTLQADTSVTNTGADVYPERRKEMGGWTVLMDEGVEADIIARRQVALPAETGGVLVGYVDIPRRLIAVVDALGPTSDSVGTSSSFIRGTAGLQDALEEVGRRTGGMVRYIGEWHTHPPLSRARPSGTDLLQLLALRSELVREGLPPTMLIAGADGVGVIQLNGSD